MLRNGGKVWSGFVTLMVFLDIPKALAIPFDLFPKNRAAVN